VASPHPDPSTLRGGRYPHPNAHPHAYVNADEPAGNYSDLDVHAHADHRNGSDGDAHAN
jgi:hypothetical protein